MKLDVQHELHQMKSLMGGGVPHEEDFLFFKEIGKREKPVVFVDVGANAGQSAISFVMSCPKSRVISFEPNPLYRPVLEGVREMLGAEKFEFHMYGLSETERESDLYIPCVDGVPYMQEASFTLSQFHKPWVRDRLTRYGTAIEFVSIRATFKIADDVIKEADVVKIDAEGAEPSVLKGMRQLIKNSSPIFLIENNSWSEVTEFLTKYGYGVYKYRKEDGLQPMSGVTTNCFYLKPEHFEIFSIKPCFG